jgi:hypothetical protein
MHASDCDIEGNSNNGSAKRYIDEAIQRTRSRTDTYAVYKFRQATHKMVEVTPHLCTTYAILNIVSACQETSWQANLTFNTKVCSWHLGISV